MEQGVIYACLKWFMCSAQSDQDFGQSVFCYPPLHVTVVITKNIKIELKTKYDLMIMY